MITQHRIDDSAKARHARKLFGVRFLWIESFVFDSASSFSSAYGEGSWDYFTLSNGGFYMAPVDDKTFFVQCANGFDGEATAQAFGIISCLNAYAFLVLSSDQSFGQQCADHWHLLREFALEHVQVKSILAAID
jgi:hypothetical protein